MRTLKEDPIRCPGGYTMDLYCKYTIDYDHDIRTNGVTVGGTSEMEVRKQVRMLGWVIHKDRTATCPDCAKALGLR